MKLCDYECNNEAKFYFKTVNKWCCSEHPSQCPTLRRKNSEFSKELHKDNEFKKKHSMGLKSSWNDINSNFNSSKRSEKLSKSIKKSWLDKTSKYHSVEYKTKRSNIASKMWDDPNSLLNSFEVKEKQRENAKLMWSDDKFKHKMINLIKESLKNNPLIRPSVFKYKINNLFFCKIEELREHPETKEIQVHCKNHNCKNSKEQGGWFTPTYIQMSERIRQLENPKGNDGSYFYCCDKCKQQCPLFGLRSDPFKNTELPYTEEERQTFRKEVLKKDNYICFFCGKNKATIVHHTLPKKLEPFHALDPDYAISVCEECHYFIHRSKEKGGECSTGYLASIICVQ